MVESRRQRKYPCFGQQLHCVHLTKVLQNMLQLIPDMVDNFLTVKTDLGQLYRSSFPELSRTY
jgi:hypothetical protein